MKKLLKVKEILKALNEHEKILITEDKSVLWDVGYYQNRIVAFPDLQPFLDKYLAVIAQKLFSKKPSSEDEDIPNLTQTMNEYIEKLQRKKGRFPCFELKEVIKAIKEEIRLIGLNKLQRFAYEKDRNYFAIPDEIEESDVKSFIFAKVKHWFEVTLMNPSSIAFFLDILKKYREEYPPYSLSKKLTSEISRATEVLLSLNDQTAIIGISPAEIRRLMDHAPHKWGVDERILVYDVIGREFAKTGKEKILFVRGRVSKDPLRRLQEKFIVISPQTLKEYTGIEDKLKVGRILSKFPNLKEPFPTNIQYLGSDEVVIKKAYLLIPDASGIAELELRSSAGVIHFEAFVLTDIAKIYFSISEEGRSYTLVEAKMFSRIKELFPTRRQDSAARLLELIIAKGQTAFITLEEIAVRLGKLPRYRKGEHGYIRKLAEDYLQTFKETGLIKDFSSENYGYKVIL